MSKESTMTDNNLKHLSGKELLSRIKETTKKLEDLYDKWDDIMKYINKKGVYVKEIFAICDELQARSKQYREDNKNE